MLFRKSIREAEEDLNGFPIVLSRKALHEAEDEDRLKKERDEDRR